MAAVAAMQPGWGLGNSLEATPDETAWGNPRTTKALLNKVRAQGFNSIRIPVTWSDHQGGAPNYTIDAAYMKRIKQAVDWALADGFYVMLNVHHDSWQWVSKMPTEHDKVLARYNATWTQIATTFKNAPARLNFEGINEPVSDDASDAQKAELLNELNTSFHGIVRKSGGHNKTRLLVLSTIGGTPSQGLMNDLATTIKSLHDKRLIATVHYYGYWPFSVNIAGSTRYDATSQKDMAKAFKLMHDIFVAKGIPVILGEYGLLGYDWTRPGLIERGEALKFFEELGYQARINGVTTNLFDAGSFLHRKTLKWRDPGLYALMKSSWSVRSATASSDMVFVPKSGTVKDRTLTLNPHGKTFKALKYGSTTLVKGKDYTLSGNRLTLKAATLTRLSGSRAYGVNATLRAQFSRGVPWQIKVPSACKLLLEAGTGGAGSRLLQGPEPGDAVNEMTAAEREMCGAKATRAALDDEQQAQVEVIEAQPVTESGAEVKAAAGRGVSGDEVAVRPGVPAEGQGDQFGGRVAPERPLVVDESGDPGVLPALGDVDEDVARPQVEVDQPGFGDLVEGVSSVGHQLPYVVWAHVQRGLPALGVVEECVHHGGERRAPVGG
ncbi:cellulase [Streptomyces dysideae]|uniref:Cellulase n=1 Tax=Streptomyces dysideae TaxID=909626 RepID=A0A124IDX2_9ACTN|nr:cellulase [Streptomyces dysideae]